MTIREMEERSGMTRANIRFYEKEGLLHPGRLENGYRDYSEADLRELEKIKLLRAVDLSVEEIREAQAGERELTALLENHLPKLRREQQRLESAQSVCSHMCADRVQYDSLEAGAYLERLNAPAVPDCDREPGVTAPWRRYFARMLDFSIYEGLTELLIFWITGLTRLDLGQGWVWLAILTDILMMLFLEPLLLKAFGTTPGKWILGLWVTDPEGGRLSYEGGLERSFGVLRYGLGFHIPGYTLYRLWKSYAACGNEPLDWEEDSVLVLKDRKPWRYGAYGLACLVLLGSTVLMVMGQRVPENRGDLTLGAYVENFNDLSKRIQGDWRKLEEDGTWEELSRYVIPLADWELPDYTYTFEGSRLTGVTFEVELEGEALIEGGFHAYKMLPVLALARAQGPVWPWSRDTEPVLQQILDHSLENWTMEAYGATIENRVELEGFTASRADGLLLVEGIGQIDDSTAADTRFHLIFSVQIP